MSLPASLWHTPGPERWNQPWSLVSLLQGGMKDSRDDPGGPDQQGVEGTDKHLGQTELLREDRGGARAVSRHNWDRAPSSRTLE